ncbi:YkgJ family cysteine cluster protein [Rhodanobacter sp. DHB23]|uniref:YkgJ family cysteine cluster protein n=1 Tax=Rhodanobacter sp. DHB23 TaxID=2775923 RepID=UPI00177C932E|nr:YkgJ family cysteine cluster protein [Rhodanobacter sp. DHB23]MBD8873529.1 YkgJ family cysteine cluster protein [Rhodanobacter sp. DHB23]
MCLSLKPSSSHAAGKAHCSRCEALCCRLMVVLQPEEKIPVHLTTRLDNGLHVMARDDAGWCVAVDGMHMRCGIYESRPQVCRRFVMNGPYCRFVRAESSEPP